MISNYHIPFYDPGAAGGGTVYSRTSSDTVSMADAHILYRARGRVPDDSVSATDTGVEREYTVAVTGAITLLESIAKELSGPGYDGGGTTYTRTQEDTIIIADGGRLYWSLRNRHLADALQLADFALLQRLRSIRISDVTSLLDVLLLSTVRVRASSDGLTTIDLSDFYRTAGRVASDAILTTDLTLSTFGRGRLLSDTLSLSEQFLKQYGLSRSFTDIISLVESVVAQFYGSGNITSLTATDLITITDQQQRVAVLLRWVLENLGVSEEVSKELLRVRQAGESIVITEGLQYQKGKFISLSDALSVSDDGRQILYDITATGRVSLFDQLIGGGLVVVTKILDDTLVVGDGLTRVFLRTRDVLGSVFVQDYSPDLLRQISLEATDSLTLWDFYSATVTGQKIVSKTLFEELSLVDSALLRRLRTLRAEDGVTLLDFLVSGTSGVVTRAFSDLTQVSDQALRSVERGRFRFEGVTLSESQIRTIGRVAGLVDSVSFEDGYLSFRFRNAAVSDGAGVTDEYIRDLLFAVLYDVRVFLGFSPEPVLGTEEVIFLGSTTAPLLSSDAPVALGYADVIKLGAYA